MEATFFQAAREGEVETLAALLESGTDPGWPDERGFTPLIVASYNGQAGAVALLLHVEDG